MLHESSRRYFIVKEEGVSVRHKHRFSTVIGTPGILQFATMVRRHRRHFNKVLSLHHARLSPRHAPP
jgi:hypothetical protein